MRKHNMFLKKNRFRRGLVFVSQIGSTKTISASSLETEILKEYSKDKTAEENKETAEPKSALEKFNVKFV